MIHLIEGGPHLPIAIDHALREDRLVLFCGAGISKAAAGLPLFDKLAEQACDKLKLEIGKTPLLKEAADKKDYSALLDLVEFSVSRKEARQIIISILDPSDLVISGKDEKSNFILNNGEKDISIHKALLELSSLPDGKGHRLVTTNFDRLFFKAKKNLIVDTAPKLIFPRQENWNNLTFLHGVIDRKNDPEGENLIITKRDFGLAYLHDMWAARFIVQLFQEFTVLFVGYSVDDPLMNYLVSAISYENQRRRKKSSQYSESQKPSIYAFAGYEEGDKEKEKSRWRSLGIEPVLYKIKENKDHSLLYDTIKKWANLKTTDKLEDISLQLRKNFLKEQLKDHYDFSEKSDRQKAKSAVSLMRDDRKLAEYLPKINFLDDGGEEKPVDISWLNAFSISEGKDAEEDRDTASGASSNSPQIQQNVWKQDLDTMFGFSTSKSRLRKLIQKTGSQGNVSLWESLSHFEGAVALWLCRHLDKKDLIHWLIEQAPGRSGLICLHPEFKSLIQLNLKRAKEKVIGKKQSLFWNLLIDQKDYSDLYPPFLNVSILIDELNQDYCLIKAKKLLSLLEPQIVFEKSFYDEKFKETLGPDKIYTAKITINSTHFPNENLTNEQALLAHAEDFSNLLKKAVEISSRIIKNGGDLSFMDRPSIAPHEQNENYYSWTYLIDLARDSFDLAVEKDKQLAGFLLEKWKFYPYPVFYRLILYAVKKHNQLDEKPALDLFEKTDALWASSCQNETLKYLKNRKHSAKALNQIVDLIMKGPSRSLYKSDVEDSEFKEFKERGIFQRLNCLELSGASLPKDISEYFNEIQKKYKIQKTKHDDKDDFPYYSEGVTTIGSEKRYHHWTNEKIFEDIKYTGPRDFNTPLDKRENFRAFIAELPEGVERAFEILSMFEDNDINSAPVWRAFIYEISTMKDKHKGNEWTLKSFRKIEKFNDMFIKNEDILEALADTLKEKSWFLYSHNKDYFEKWWRRSWRLSIKGQPYGAYSDPSFRALNSCLGKLSQSVFNILWKQFPGNIPKDGKIPEDIKKYFQIIIRGGIKKIPSVLYHFGSYLWHLWFLDKEWSNAHLKPLLDWGQNEAACKAVWSGYLHHKKFSAGFVSDFKNEFSHLFLKRKVFCKGRDAALYYESIAVAFFISTGGRREIKNIFTAENKKEDKSKAWEIIQNIEILEPISRIIANLLKNSDIKSESLWSDEIRPWMQKFWPHKMCLKNQKIAGNLSLATLRCGKKFPEALEFLKHNIEDVIKKNNSYIADYIINSKENLLNIFDFPEELLRLLSWNFPEDDIFPYTIEKVKSVLDEIKSKKPEVAQSANYRKLLKKCQ